MSKMSAVIWRRKLAEYKMINPSNNVKDSFVAVTIEAVRLKKSVKIKSENELSQLRKKNREGKQGDNI